ncbi:MAG: DUF411 domain-containing protein [Vulcanimicrobiaceae bacterium]
MTRSALLALLAAATTGAAPSRPHVVTYRDTGCGCCEGWVRVARENGYAVELHDLERDVRVKRFGLTAATAGCHTSLVGGYIVEGHVPMPVLARLLHERPHIRGIAFPGMPTGVAGMPGPRGNGSEIVTLENRPRIFARV